MTHRQIQHESINNSLKFCWALSKTQDQLIEFKKGPRLSSATSTDIHVESHGEGVERSKTENHSYNSCKFSKIQMANRIVTHILFWVSSTDWTGFMYSTPNYKAKGHIHTRCNSFPMKFFKSCKACKYRALWCLDIKRKKQIQCIATYTYIYILCNSHNCRESV